MCAIVSAHLLQMLEDQGLAACIAVLDTEDCGGHCFVECEGYLVDVTSSQFGTRAVEVHRLDAKPDKVFWTALYRVSSADALRQLLEELDWPEEQWPWRPGQV